MGSLANRECLVHYINIVRVVICYPDNDWLQIDLKKMPLGKLSKKQIKSAYSVLTELQGVSCLGGPASEGLFSFV